MQQLLGVQVKKGFNIISLDFQIPELLTMEPKTKQKRDGHAQMYSERQQRHRDKYELKEKLMEKKEKRKKKDRLRYLLQKETKKGLSEAEINEKNQLQVTESK